MAQATRARHALVTLVTCTLGEEGEIVVPHLEHLASSREDGLGWHRIDELAAACEALGVSRTTASSAAPGAGATAG